MGWPQVFMGNHLADLSSSEPLALAVTANLVWTPDLLFETGTTAFECRDFLSIVIVALRIPVCPVLPVLTHSLEVVREDHPLPHH